MKSVEDMLKDIRAREAEDRKESAVSCLTVGGILALTFAVGALLLSGTVYLLIRAVRLALQ